MSSRQKSGFVRFKSLPLVLLFFALVLAGAAQDVPSSREQQKTEPHPSSTQAGSKPADENSPPDSERVFGVVRTFGITNDKNAAPLTPRGKFRIFTQNVSDPFTFVGTALQAGSRRRTSSRPTVKVRPDTRSASARRSPISVLASS
jgi:hypothetical protein